MLRLNSPTKVVPGQNGRWKAPVIGSHIQLTVNPRIVYGRTSIGIDAVCSFIGLRIRNGAGAGDGQRPSEKHQPGGSLPWRLTTVTFIIIMVIIDHYHCQLSSFHSGRDPCPQHVVGDPGTGKVDTGRKATGDGGLSLSRYRRPGGWKTEGYTCRLAIGEERGDRIKQSFGEPTLGVITAICWETNRTTEPRRRSLQRERTRSRGPDVDFGMVQASGRQEGEGTTVGR